MKSRQAHATVVNPDRHKAAVVACGTWDERGGRYPGRKRGVNDAYGGCTRSAIVTTSRHCRSDSTQMVVERVGGDGTSAVGDRTLMCAVFQKMRHVTP